MRMTREGQSKTLLIGILALCGALWAALIAIVIVLVLHHAKPTEDALAELARSDSALPPTEGEGSPASQPSAAPLPPAEPAHGAIALQPVGSMADWFPIDAYPVEAIRREEQGRVVLAVQVGGDGKARTCEMLTTSGSAILDNATCQRVKDHGRFRIRRDDRGQPIVYWGRMAPVRWVLPQ